MIGQACPSDSTRRSAAAWFGCAGSYRMWVYISTVTRCARLAADVGCPEPAAVVMSRDNLIRSITLACTEATKAIFYPPRCLGCGCSRSGDWLERTHYQTPSQLKLSSRYSSRPGRVPPAPRQPGKIRLPDEFYSSGRPVASLNSLGERSAR